MTEPLTQAPARDQPLSLVSPELVLTREIEEERLLLVNSSTVQYLFKVKVNVKGACEIVPSVGFVNPGTTFAIRVSLPGHRGHHRSSSGTAPEVGGDGRADSLSATVGPKRCAIQIIGLANPDGAIPVAKGTAEMSRAIAYAEKQNGKVLKLRANVNFRYGGQGATVSVDASDSISYYSAFSYNAAHASQASTSLLAHQASTSFSAGSPAVSTVSAVGPTVASMLERSLVSGSSSLPQGRSPGAPESQPPQALQTQAAESTSYAAADSHVKGGRDPKAPACDSQATGPHASAAANQGSFLLSEVATAHGGPQSSERQPKGGGRGIVDLLDSDSEDFTTRYVDAATRPQAGVPSAAAPSSSLERVEERDDHGSEPREIRAGDPGEQVSGSLDRFLASPALTVVKLQADASEPSGPSSSVGSAGHKDVAKSPLARDASDLVSAATSTAPPKPPGGLKSAKLEKSVPSPEPLPAISTSNTQGLGKRPPKPVSSLPLRPDPSGDSKLSDASAISAIPAPANPPGQQGVSLSSQRGVGAGLSTGLPSSSLLEVGELAGMKARIAQLEAELQALRATHGCSESTVGQGITRSEFKAEPPQELMLRALEAVTERIRLASSGLGVTDGQSRPSDSLEVPRTSQPTQGLALDPALESVVSQLAEAITALASRSSFQRVPDDRFSVSKQLGPQPAENSAGGAPAKNASSSQLECTQPGVATVQSTSVEYLGHIPLIRVADTFEDSDSTPQRARSRPGSLPGASAKDVDTPGGLSVKEQPGVRKKCGTALGARDLALCIAATLIVLAAALFRFFISK